MSAPGSQGDMPVDGTAAQPLASGAIAATAASAFFVLSGYVINIALGRSLGPVDYGLFGVVIGLMTLINSLQVNGVPQAVAKFVAEVRYRPEDLLLTGGTLQVATGLGLGAALFVLADQLATVFGDPRLVEAFRIAACALPPYAVFSLLLGFQGGRGRYVRQAGMQSVYSASKAALAIGLGLLFALPGAIAGYVIAPAIGVLSNGAVTIRDARLVGMRPLISYSIPLLLLASLSIGFLSVDLFFVKALVDDPASAGYYTAAQNIARVPFFLISGLTVILLPAVARAMASKSHDAAELVTEALRFSLLLVVPVTVLLVAASDDLIRLFYGDRYVPAISALALLAPAMGTFAIVAMFTSLLAGAGRQAEAIASAAAGLACSSLSAIALVPGMGIEGAALATLAGSIVSLVIASFASLRAFSFAIPRTSIVRVTIASAVVGAIASLLNGTVATIVGLPLLAAAYGALLLLMREVGAKDWRRIRAPARATRE